MRELLLLVYAATGLCSGASLAYAPAPVDNPLKGMVPYVSSEGVERFPHSLEFCYVPLKRLMKGRGEFDWVVVEETLKTTGERGCQLVMRVYVEYPGKGNEVPGFLIDEGVKVTVWKEDDGKVNHTPDYADPKMRSALREFVGAFGKKYDGDPRMGFITAGLLGSWGEWHTYPREDLWASKEVQAEVMEAYEQAFKTTPVLLRYPAGPKSWRKASNVERPFGYHDDSFAWATLDTGREEDDWYFLAQMKAVGAGEKWKRFPIGGELRPELWKTSFTERPHQRDQGFRKCVEATHVTWLMDSGLFQKKIPLPEKRKTRAMEEVRRMGYEYHISKAEVTKEGEVKLTVENRGVAPFYADWPVDLLVRRTKLQSATRTGRAGLLHILPGESREWVIPMISKEERERYSLDEFPVDQVWIAVRNPMEGGKALRFANEEQGEEWLKISF